MMVKNAEAQSDYVSFEKANTEIDTTMECDKYADCFNCTLSNCDWKSEMGTCYDFMDVKTTVPIT
jgi:hypothetical protein